MPFRSTKTYGHNIGLSACFRQWRATHSHCQFLHGYALEVHVEFQCEKLDDKNWCIDFGGLKDFKLRLQQYFDHKTVVAFDDPHLDYFKQGHQLGVLDLVVAHDGVGCELFARKVFDLAREWLAVNLLDERVFVAFAEVREHGGNSAKYTEKYT